MNEPLSSTERPTNNESMRSDAKKKGFNWLPAIVLLSVFLIGFAPMWLKSNRLTRELNRAQISLRLGAIQLTLATAALDARRGEYETSRQGMVSFFNLITSELDRGVESALPSSAGADLKPLLDQRDNLITLLARNDPAAAERLAGVCESFRKSLVK
jgi:hypothetical protein